MFPLQKQLLQRRKFTQAISLGPAQLGNLSVVRAQGVGLACGQEDLAREPVWASARRQGINTAITGTFERLRPFASSSFRCRPTVRRISGHARRAKARRLARSPLRAFGPTVSRRPRFSQVLPEATNPRAVCGLSPSRKEAPAENRQGPRVACVCARSLSRS